MNEQILQMLTQQMAGQKNTENNDAPDMSSLMMQMLQNNMADKSNEDEAEGIELTRLEKKLRKSKKINQVLKSQLEIAIEFIGQFSDLVGACPECLGQVPECQQCRGVGGPGSRAPDNELIQWIEPALRGLGLEIVEQQQISTKTDNLSQHQH